MPEKDWTALEAGITEEFDDKRYEAAAERLLKSYGPQVLGYLVRALGDPAEASEVYAMFCEDLWKGLPTFEKRSSFRTWSYRLATSARAHFRRDPGRRRGRPLMSDELNALAEKVRTDTLPYLKTDVKDRFAALRRELSEEEQLLLTLRVDRDMDWKDIALIFAETADEISEVELDSRSAALRQKFKRTKDKLRKLAESAGLLPTD